MPKSFHIQIYDNFNSLMTFFRNLGQLAKKLKVHNVGAPKLLLVVANPESQFHHWTYNFSKFNVFMVFQVYLNYKITFEVSNPIIG